MQDARSGPTPPEKPPDAPLAFACLWCGLKRGEGRRSHRLCPGECADAYARWFRGEGDSVPMGKR